MQLDPLSVLKLVELHVRQVVEAVLQVVHV